MSSLLEDLKHVQYKLSPLICSQLPRTQVFKLTAILQTKQLNLVKDTTSHVP